MQQDLHVDGQYRKSLQHVCTLEMELSRSGYQSRLAKLQWKVRRAQAEVAKERHRFAHQRRATVWFCRHHRQSADR